MSLPVDVLVGANLMPTMGTYGNIFPRARQLNDGRPSAVIADGNGTLTAPSVSPLPWLPGSGAGATLSIAADGTVTVNSDSNTTLGNSGTVRAQANDTCGGARQTGHSRSRSRRSIRC